MVVSRRVEPPDLVVATLAGVVTSDDQADLLQVVRASIRRAGTVRLLIILNAFSGWNPGESLDRAAAWLDDDEGVSKFALVGRREWKLSVLMLLAQPLRQPANQVLRDRSGGAAMARCAPSTVHSRRIRLTTAAPLWAHDFHGGPRGPRLWTQDYVLPFELSRAEPRCSRRPGRVRRRPRRLRRCRTTRRATPAAEEPAQKTEQAPAKSEDGFRMGAFTFKPGGRVKIDVHPRLQADRQRGCLRHPDDSGRWQRRHQLPAACQGNPPEPGHPRPG